MRAELKSMFSPDADPLEDFQPAGPFGILVMAMIGPAGDKGEESFDFMLCTPEWFSANAGAEFTIGRHHLFVRGFDYGRLKAFVEDYCASCGDEPSWARLADKLSRLGKWEFEDYQS
ncbi:immunity 8 family protein [Bradyrhizobium sp. Pear76]|uniref:immunity 8 family protein n=1 Tax=Bradyrhizobium oropedii TaxID=1571201 RepID=UPI001E549E52|nr:immunity 8 family protein [Bradyrhizobium oropedii]MCC8961137.1 immunity 8 family protein [Bradyrhizobium oropedii]